MRINTNVPSLYSYNALSATTNALQNVISKLSTGLRINSAADDAAGLAISEKMRAQYRGLDQATNNAQDGISMIQTAEGALNETHSILQRMRELSVQAANDTLTAEDRAYIQLEVDQLKEEIDRISTTTQFNKKQLLDGSAAALWSTSDLETKVVVNGGLREVDQFGQKRAVEGNYKITIKADPGETQIQKSNVFKIKNANVITDLYMNDNFSVRDVSVDNVPAGDWTISLYSTSFNDDLGVLRPGYEQASFGYWNMVGAGASYGASNRFAYIPDGLDPTGLDRPFDSVNNFGFDSSSIGSLVQALEHDGVDMNITTLWEVVGIDTVNQTVTFDVQAKGLSVEGDAVSFVGTTLTIGVGGLSEGNIDGLGIHVEDGAFFLFDAVTYVDGRVEDFYTVGAKSAMTFMPQAGVGKDYTAIDIRGVLNSYEWDGAWSNKRWDVGGRNASIFAIDNTKLANKTVSFDTWFVNWDNGSVHDSSFTVEFGEDIARTDYADTSVWGGTGKITISSFEALASGMVARGDTKLSDIDKFWDVNGRFLLSDPQTITVTRGDGKQAKLTLYGSDTIDDVRRKLNDTIAIGLDQTKYLGSGQGADTFVTYQQYTHTTGLEMGVDDLTGDPVELWTAWYGDGPPTNTPESVAGTFVIRSVIPGKEGELSLSGSEDFMKALGLNVIQESRESRYTANITDAHTGNTIASNVKVTGNRLLGVLHENVDVVFDTMANTDVIWNDQMRKFVLARANSVYETIVHLSDNTTTFQIGANAGEDMSVDIGDMSSSALGVNDIIVTDRESAGRAITKIDEAISKVSMQRAKLGAYQNRLEHTINNLTTASTNLKSSESRIRDTDMAKEMMEFTKLNILSQAGNSMLAQANQLPQNILSLLR